MACWLINSMTQMQHLTPSTVSTVGTSDTLHDRFVRITYATCVIVDCILDDAFSDDAMLTPLEKLLLFFSTLHINTKLSKAQL